MLSEKCKLKWESTIYLSEWPKPRTLTTPDAGKCVEQQELYSTAGGNAKWHSHFGQFDSFLQHKIYTYHMIQQPFSWYLPKGPENSGLKKNLYVDIYSCFILNHQKLEATKISFSRWIYKQTVVHLDNRLLFRAKKETSYQAMKRHAGNLYMYYLAK